ncbi:MAG: TadE family protein [Coriobacteriales bacterium]
MTEHSHNTHTELGAETVQLAIAMPLFIIVTMAFVQLCVMAFSVLTLSGEVEQAAWGVDVEELARCSGSEEANKLVRDEIIASAGKLDHSSLVVSNASFSQQDSYSHYATTPIINNNVVVDEEEHSRYQLGEFYRETSAGLVEFDVSFELPTLINLPGLAHMKVSKHIARERAVLTRTEIR